MGRTLPAMSDDSGEGPELLAGNGTARSSEDGQFVREHDDARLRRVTVGIDCRVGSGNMPG
jgi:hypothetical protein